MTTPTPRKDTTLSYNELLLFISQTEHFVRVSMGAIKSWVETAKEIQASPALQELEIDGMNPELVADLIQNGDALLGVPCVYLIHVLTSALDAYLRGLALAQMKQPPFDDSWFDLSAAELILGIKFDAIESFEAIGRLYETREVISRLEFTIDWTLDYALSLPRRVAIFARDLHQLVTHNDPEAAS